VNKEHQHQQQQEEQQEGRLHLVKKENQQQG
jgi:hypothetical protein